MEFSAVNTIWVLVGAALVFFMQAGFAMVETGFTRAKNAGNIIMKNLMDFCIGTPVFWLVGQRLLQLVEDVIQISQLDEEKTSYTWELVFFKQFLIADRNIFQKLSKTYNCGLSDRIYPEAANGRI